MAYRAHRPAHLPRRLHRPAVVAIGNTESATENVKEWNAIVIVKESENVIVNARGKEKGIAKETTVKSM